ncbi:hypothetical protein SAMN02745165_01936 [Malonomonas rubra DSM 5091]|uniref:HAMP domain-containing protein n=1 Tax=Malonomonas rubra DSM 5091 TaxID=1122189 RepID=A0A1M6HZ83_MALRU|nr:methyl-accepting chemotaxis protein [Malonomonas rubra]SHJ27435.1 hypothetical protein SAMN02745165_01936 [Malonomonas rubra DSM 5091]
MITSRRYHRKLLNFSINRKMQLGMIVRISSILFVCLLLSSAIYFHYANQEITGSFKMFHVKARNFLDMLLPIVSVSFLISLLCGVIASLFFPKPFAGGLYRIEEDLRHVIASGDLTYRIRLREGDQVMAVAEQINLLLKDFQRRVGISQQQLEQLEKIELDSDESDALIRISSQLQEQLGTLKSGQEQV